MKPSTIIALHVTRPDWVTDRLDELIEYARNEQHNKPELFEIYQDIESALLKLRETHETD